jgi:outer membrane lipoprotein-sorting protein
MDMTFENSQPVSMIINDAMQQKSVLNFSHVSINPDTKPDKFSFIAPAGVDVLKAK